MDHANELHPRARPFGAFAGALAVVAGIVAVAAAVGWLGTHLNDLRRARGGFSAPEAGLFAICRVCGVVESVRVVPPDPPRGGSTGAPPSTEGLLGATAGLQFGGNRGEAVALLLATLGAAMLRPEGPPPLYETSVLLDDGSVRLLREAGEPPWKPGDRVKVTRGRIERLN